MDVRSLLRWPLGMFPGMYRTLRPWLARRGPYVARCGALRMELDFDDHTARRYYLYGKPEHGIPDYLLSLLESGMTFFDVGSNWGYYALLAAKKVGPSGKVIAFEPDPGNMERIRTNLKLNPDLQVTVEALAVSDKEGEATLRAGSDSGKGSIVTEPGGADAVSFTVRTVSLDGYLDEHRIDRVDLMKMDIEGAEVQAIEGMAEGLKAGRYGRIVLEWHGGVLSGPRPRRALERLLECGYQLEAIGGTEPKGISIDDIGDKRMHVSCRAPL